MENSSDVLNDQHIKPTLPSGLNVLTILTLVWSAVQLISALWGFISAKKTYDGIEKLSEQMNSDSMPGWLKSIMGDPETMIKTITKSYENRIPIVLMSVVAVALCVYGALQMRQLKKQGFLFYTIGELLPFLTQFLFIGAFTFAGVGMYFFVAIALLFILLYAGQRKHLIY